MTKIAKVLIAAALLSMAGCGQDKPEEVAGPEPFKVTEPISQPDKPGVPERFPPIRDPRPESYTEDGIPVMTVRSTAQQREGQVTWISEAWNALQIALFEATDGKRIYFAKTGVSQNFADVLIRDGQIYTDVIEALSGVEPHPGGCAGATDGRVLLSSPDHAPLGHGNQKVWTIEPGGEVKPVELPEHTSSAEDCKVWLDADGAFALGTFGVLTWDGKQFAGGNEWFSGRTEMAGARGPRFCFASCNAYEKSDDGGAAQQALDQAIGGCYARYHVYQKWVVAECRRERKVGRIALGGSAEVITNLPKGRNDYGDIIAITERGDVVIGLDYGMRSYVVWRSGSSTLSPVRQLGPNEALAQASPTLLVRGLPPRVPDDSVGATVLGAKIAFGAGGSTYGYHSIDRQQAARRAATDRAKRVLPRTRRLVVVHEAVVDLECGAYVRSPIGWEEMRIHDWSPPQLPPLFKAAVYDPPFCLPLEQVVAVPGDPDLLLARTRDGRLVGAWLPTALPLPSGSSHFHPKPPQPPPVQHPGPGSGWIDIGRADKIVGIPGLSAPGEDSEIDSSSWLAGGAAVITTGGTKILVTPHGPVTLPQKVTPLSMLQYEPGVYGAVGSRLLFCDRRCRILDPGPKRKLIAAVPRAKDLLVLGYDDGRNGLYRVPAHGGKPVPEHPLTNAIRQLIAKRPAAAPKP
ncbi:MAG: hypothetical protein JRF63_01845 [Deltaproteobacteria bacterium]|nr:hypothetical protein [Deltaproteobacteria bacterium]